MVLKEAKKAYDNLLFEFERKKNYLFSSYKRIIHEDDKNVIKECLEDLCALAQQESVLDEYHECLYEERTRKKKTLREPLRRQIIESYFDIQGFLTQHCEGKEAKS